MEDELEILETKAGRRVTELRLIAETVDEQSLLMALRIGITAGRIVTLSSTLNEGRVWSFEGKRATRETVK